MVFFVARTAALLLHSHSAVKVGHPVEDVIAQLKRLSAQVEEEGQSEALTYEKFQHWCMRSKKKLTETIADEKATLESLEEKISAADEDIAALTSDIDRLGNEMDKLEREGVVARGDRQFYAGVAVEEATALADTIKAIQDALTAMTTAESKTEPSMLESRISKVLELASALSDMQRSLLQTFASPERPDLKAAGDYTSHVDKYDFKSHKVVELLKSLEAKFQNEFVERNAAEQNSVNAYNLAKEAREDLEKAAWDAKIAKVGTRTTVQAQRGTDLQSQSDTREDLSADAATLKTTTQDCQTKATEWAERSTVREHEREAIAAAIEILAKATGVRTEAPANPTMPPSEHPLSFLQLVSPEVQQALKLLRKEARVTHSEAISQLADAVYASAEGPFDAVVNSIEKLIFHLMNEQRDEDNHKNWCDKELQKTENSLSDQGDKISELDSNIQVAKTRAVSLQSDIVAASDMVSALTDHMKEATEIRKVGKEENSLALKDADAAQVAVTNAISVLEDFYKSTGSMTKQSWELLQRGAGPVTLPANPATWSSPYVGLADPVDATSQPKGIVTVLQAVLSDFELMQANTLAQEESDQSEFEQDIKTCKIELARRGKEAQMKAQERERLMARQASWESARKGVMKEKEATNQYKSDLQPACVDGSSTYTQRKAARDDEIAALKHAQSHLQNAFTATTTATSTALPGRSTTK